MDRQIISEFIHLLGEENVREQEPMARHTSFRIGGPAALFLMPGDENCLAQAVRICRMAGLPFFILGNGTNLLVSDEGYQGVVIQTAHHLQTVSVKENMVSAQAGALLSRTSAAARDASLTGMEFAGGIPGTVGGAVAMNAGAYGGEIRDVLLKARLLTPEGKIIEASPDELELGYRTSRLRKTGEIVLEAIFALEPGRKEEIAATMRELAARRAEKQPLEYPSAGSTFKRPVGYYAGKLIMDCGLRGYRVGGAEVSEKHCGFVINRGGATAGDVRRLMDDVTRTVLEKTGVRLEPEVQFLP